MDLFSENRPSGSILSSQVSVHVSVRWCVCLFTFEVLFKRLLPPIHEVGYPKCLEITNPWGKVMDISGLSFGEFY